MSAGEGTSTSARGQVDGRTLRGERTRTAIVEALIGLLHEGEERPTAKQIAQRAGVSVRSIFQHFDDLEGLYADLVKVQAARVEPLVEAIDHGGDLATRCAALARQRAALFEAIRPIRHAVGTRARTSPVIAQRIQDLSARLERQVREQFAAELAGAEGALLSIAVDVVASFDAWDHLRGHHGLEAEVAEQVLCRSVERLLSPG
jgi:TetR/AcrR family transcriptional regulator of autoinduction and epiphytic fitness